MSVSYSDFHTQDTASHKDIILSSGDISDVDGFFALAEYARSGASCVFIMNYPQFLDPSIDEDMTQSRNDDGLGFTYGVNAISPNKNTPEKYTYWYNERYKTSLENIKANMKQSYTDIAYRLCRRIWLNTEVNPGLKKGDLFFYVGGINKVNPFASKIVKRESEHWYHYVDLGSTMLSTTEGSLVDSHEKSHELASLLRKYENIYMDFNGSAAFFNQDFEDILRRFPSKFGGFFVAGGVLSDQNPMTMVSSEFLNRFSGSTMNQLYHPEHTIRMMNFVQNTGMITYTVSNNTVQPLENKAQITNVLVNRDIASDICIELVEGYYSDSSPFPPKKLFDLYTAVALTNRISGRHVKSEAKSLYVLKTYGFCVVSSQHKAEAAFQEYFSLLEFKISNLDMPMTSFTIERDVIMSEIAKKRYETYLVYDTTMRIDPGTYAIQIQSHCPWHALDRLSDIVLELHSTTV